MRLLRSRARELKRTANDRDTAFSRVIVNIVGNLTPPLAAVITLPVLARTLGVDGRGSVTAVTAPFLLVVAAGAFGLPEALTYFIARDRVDSHRAFRSATLLIIPSTVVVAGALVFAAPVLGGQSIGLSRLITWTSLAILPALYISLLRGVASALQRWRLIATERCLTSVSRLLSLCVLTSTGQLSIESAVACIILSPVVGGLVYLRTGQAAFRSTGTTDGTGSLHHSANQLVTYGGRVWLGAISGILLSRIDQALMTPLTSVYELGLYTVAVAIAELPLIINLAVRDVMFASDAADPDDSVLTMAARLGSTATALAAVALGVTIPLWLPLALGDSFKPAIPITILLLLAVVLGTPGSVAGAGLSARGRPGLRSLALMLACLANLALVIVLVPRHGAFGAAVATLTGNLISANVSIVALRRIFQIPVLSFYGIRAADLKVASWAASRLLRSGSNTERKSAGEGGELSR